MKLLKLLMTVVLTINVACQEEEEPQGQMQGSIECNIDGQAWKATNTVAGQQDFEKLTIIGRDGKGAGIALYIPNSELKAGSTIKLAATGMGIIAAATKFTKADGKEFYVTTGSIVVTNAVNKKVEGNFDFKSIEGGTTLNVTNGRFSVSY
jgi:uncharacterized protein with LGFP repeats